MTGPRGGAHPDPAAPDHADPDQADTRERVFLTLFLGGILAALVGGLVPGLLWLTVPGVLAFLGAAAAAARSAQRGPQ